ncbi:MAG: diguanylate cyclase [Actinobacteria bacterium]|nr:diguanylate cyclase [Actinomycetota bacterium]NIS36262.1 diguanylate cyclase [Actinomycetota bacterium]NIT98619.1 diguanylate cyclase [Actinomycetota bacterium]NIU22242.1 diguanylate cyclase [Actinomycetota bacterium]NIU70814.1 diguanylate cyclase [Actinomycetota bacterium]
MLYVDPVGDAAQLARLLEEATEFDFAADDSLIEVRASAGAVVGDRATTTIEDLLRNADLAMYDNKRLRQASLPELR